MPQFEMPLANTAEIVAFSDLDEFTQGYVEAMFWTECNSDNPELEDATFGDLAPETLAAIIEDCAAFQDANADDLAKAYETEKIVYDESRAGHDYWLTRNGHGAGFWDRGLGFVGEALSIACRHRTVDLYRGDDGRLYI